MKDLFRSIGGKTLLFLICCLLVFSALGSLCMLLYPEASAPEFIGALFPPAEKTRNVIVFTGSVLLFIACFIGLMCVSGRRPETEEVFPGPLHVIPFDVLLAVCLFATYAAASLFLEDFVFGRDEPGYLVGLVLVLFFFISTVLGLCMSAAARLKRNTLFSTSLIFLILKGFVFLLKQLFRLLRRFCKAVLSFLRGIPTVMKTVLFCIAVLLFELFAFPFFGYYDYYVFCYALFILIVNLILSVFAISTAIGLKKLQKGGEALASGNLSYHMETKGLLWDLKKHGENLNRIADGMSIAVEDRLKSERMKTELITNVSHDIKTPLTSIINYTDLISKESCDNENIREYTQVLLRQSERLKRLIEDLVEASKASTGNLEVRLSPCDASVFLTQAGGEYEERLNAAGLELVVSQPDEEVRILADGRRMQRIFDNLMNNILKYAQPGTRVYLSLETIGQQAVITFKNTSKDALNISPDELMERFTRGDASRSTEGNGLGLSIAKSLADLQGGHLWLTIDGDLFKASLSFPVLSEA